MSANYSLVADAVRNLFHQDGSNEESLVDEIFWDIIHEWDKDHYDDMPHHFFKKEVERRIDTLRKNLVALTRKEI